MLPIRGKAADRMGRKGQLRQHFPGIPHLIELAQRKARDPGHDDLQNPFTNRTTDLSLWKVVELDLITSSARSGVGSKKFDAS